MKRNISRSLKEGVSVEISNSAAAMEEYYKLHCITRQGHGIPPPADQVLPEDPGACSSRKQGLRCFIEIQGKHCSGGGLFPLREEGDLQIRSFQSGWEGKPGEQPGHVGSDPLVSKERVRGILLRTNGTGKRGVTGIQERVRHHGIPAAVLQVGHFR